MQRFGDGDHGSPEINLLNSETYLSTCGGGGSGGGLNGSENNNFKFLLFNEIYLYQQWQYGAENKFF